MNFKLVRSGAAVLALAASLLLPAPSYAEADKVCVLHNDHEIWVDDDSLSAHLKHGDTLCQV